MIKLKAICALAACLGALVVGLHSSFAADQGVVNFSGKDPSEDDIIDALIPKTAKTRGLSPGAINSGGAAAAPSVAKASFDQIVFELNSDRIAPRARTYLDKIGKALRSDELSEVSITIEGHTDISGSLDYNMRLST